MVVKGPNGEPDVVVSAADRRRLGGKRALLASGVNVDMSLEKELGELLNCAIERSRAVMWCTPSNEAVQSCTQSLRATTSHSINFTIQNEAVT